jgi:hypothetical protein
MTLMFILGVYLGIGVLISLVPMPAAMNATNPLYRVIGGLMWPLVIFVGLYTMIFRDKD